MALTKASSGPTGLRVAVGDYPEIKALKSGLLKSDLIQFQFEKISPINRAFAPMVRDAAFDVSELALASFLQAKAYGIPLVLLPIIMVARFQESALFCLADGPVKGPADLAGRRVGLRAYSQMTGAWLRGILHDRFGLLPNQIRWVTLEDAHTPQYNDPPWAERAAAGKDLVAMLHAGELDAVMMGLDIQADASLRQVFPDVSASEKLFWNQHKFVPINHMLTVRQEIAEKNPEVVEEVVRLCKQSRDLAPRKEGIDPLAPSTRAEIDPILEVALRYSEDLLPHQMTLDEVWDGSPINA